MKLFIATLASCACILFTEVQSKGEITSLDVTEATKYLDLGKEKDIGTSVANLIIKLCSPANLPGGRVYPLVFVEIFALQGGKAVDRIVMSKESYNFEKDVNESYTSNAMIISNLIQLSRTYPLTATLKVDGRSTMHGHCVRRTYTDGSGTPLPKYDEEELSSCSF